MTIASKLPKNAIDGAEICDRYGNRWQFAADSDAWISKGVITTYLDVTEENDGLVTPDLFQKIRNLETLSSSFDLSPLKILPGRDAYWYYFRSSDKLFKFKPESESSLRIEIDKGRLYQLLSKNRKPGLRGTIGLNGDDGLDGLPGLSICDPEGGEPCFQPSLIDKNRLDFAIFTPIPLVLDGPITLPNNHVPDISVRLFKIIKKSEQVNNLDQLNALSEMYLNSFNVSQRFTLTKNMLAQRSMGIKQIVNLCEIPMSSVLTSPGLLSSYPHVTIDISPINPSNITISSSSNIQINISKTKNSIQYDNDTQIVCGSIYLVDSGSWLDEWCIKSRQRGPDGEDGDPGECRIKISESIVDNTNIEAICPIVNVRFDRDKSILYTMCVNLLDEICVSRARLIPKSETLTNNKAINNVFAAAQMILDECKYVYRFMLDLPEDNFPELQFVHWDPQPGCLTQRHFNRHKFDWIDLVKTPPVDGSAGGVDMCGFRPYPWRVLLPKMPPPGECCEDDFFYCPNVQDGPCVGEPPSTPPG